MQYYHTDNGKNSLIVFFLGWAMDKNPFEHLQSKVSDVLFVWDYNDINLNFDFSNYKQVDVISFSYGVFISSLLLDKIPNLKNSVAINGTLVPIDKHLGITPMKFDLTLKALPERFSDKFYKSMFASDDEYDKFLAYKPKRDLSSLKSELENIKSLSQTFSNNPAVFTKAVISSQDKLIPTQNQLNFWQNRTKTVMIDGGHFPFYQFNSIDEIISL